jgi:phosphoenolpyruvate phosphomutase
MQKKMILVSAGDAITARLAQEAGFDGIWISGFEASARLGLADNGSITMTEMLNIAKPIVEAVNLPVWVDTDTGYGNFQRTVKEFERIGVAGVCVEDNIPDLKENSLWGGKIPLMDRKEFGRKISVKRNTIKVIARTEALIRKYSMEEAVERVRYYHDCGADIVLPHARREQDIINWGEKEFKCAIVPTKFPKYTNKKLFDMGYDYVIWANQTERVKIKATRECLGSLMGSDCAAFIEANLSATLDDMKGLTPSD